MGRMERRGESGTSRFVRAVHVESDVDKDDALDGYVLTATGRGIIQRIGPACNNDKGPRAWTLTGPYGTGKSAFALFAANLFGRSKNTGTKKARTILEETDPKLATQLLGNGRQATRGLMPIVVTGTREPIEAAILRALEHSLTHNTNGGTSSVARNVRKCLKTAESGKSLGARNLIELLDTALKKTCTSSARLSGVFLVIDELGKLLEFANSHPGHSDISILQGVAEFAERSAKPCLVLTILHQDFGAYATRLSAADKAEWEKVRGRFEDIAFEEPAEEMLRLVARALSFSRANRSGRAALPRSFRALCEAAWKLGLAPGSMRKKEFLDLLHGCCPLHPVVAVMLGSVFRRLAQNERSAFSFLNSSEPFGFREFFNTTVQSSGSLYGVDRLYDYLNHSIRDGLYASPQAKRWAETESILEGQPDAGARDVFFIKAIGLINAIGQSGGLRATRELLDFAAQRILVKPNTRGDLKRLVSRSVVVERRYNNTFALWEGSDVDLDAQARLARDRMEPSTTTATLAAKYFAPRPLVARRHSFRTGALRYFPVDFVTPDDLRQRRRTFIGPRILVVLAENAAGQKRALTLAGSDRIKKLADVVLCIPAVRREFAKDVRQLACLEWVRENTPELDGDRTARRELAVRIDGFRRKLEETFGSILGTSRDQSDSSVWVHKGQRVRFSSRRELQSRLSEICDEVFSKSPCLRNELINRRELSSAAAAARRNLVDRMITHPTEKDLGIEKTPPEKSMYLSLLVQPGIHREGNDGYAFRQPRDSADPGVVSVWKAIVHFFNGTEKGAKPLSELFEKLSAAPYGLLEGPMPVLLCAALLAYDSEVALYKEGSFVPILNVPDFELLMKAPGRYSVQRWRVTGVRASVFEQLAQLIGRDIPGPKIGKPQILQVVRPFLRFVRSLNDYVKRTEKLSEIASNVRDCLLRAREPDTLLFTDLPKACGVPPFRSRQRAKPKQVEGFIKRLRGGLGELQQCYPRLLEELLRAIRVSFAVEGSLPEVRKRLADRAALLRNCAGDPTLKKFVNRVLQKDLDDDEWLETVVGVLALRLPPVWRDGERERFDQAIATTARLFHHVESLTFDKSELPDVDEAVRIGITTPDAVEIEKIVRISAKQRDAVTQLERRLEATLNNVKGANNNDVVLAAVARVAQRRLNRRRAK